MAHLTRFLADARRDAWAVEDSRWARSAARAGYAAEALLLVGIGVLALLLALHAPGAAPDSSGAFGDIARVPGGVVLLFAVAAGEYALAAWLLLAGAARRGTSLESWRRRVVKWGRAPVYAVVGTIALRFALGAHENSRRTDRESSRHLLSVPGGAVVLALIGAVVVIVGLSLVWLGVSRRFEKTVHLPRSVVVRRGVVGIGIVGYVARGVTVTVVGVLVVLAAITLDAAKAEGLDGALGGFATSGPGRVVLAAIALGWIAAGCYTVARAVLARFG